MINIQKRKIFLSIAAVLAVYTVLCVFLSYRLDFSSARKTALFISGILATVNIVISFMILLLSYDSDIKGFMIKYFGGMGIRMLFLLLIVFLALKFMIIDIFVFILSLFVLYFVFQALEIYFIHSYQKRK